ncbi:MAG: hypothetical protein H7X95_05825 [Deltaproteobacteria bacterium]|nr:hypothetical protein [Deltaproteobacteria bacterium]
MRGALRTDGGLIFKGIRRAILAAALVATSATCNRRPAGTCAQDIDCAPGYDCRAGACVVRERMRFDSPTKKPPPEVTPPGEGPPAAAGIPDASATDADAVPLQPPPRPKKAAPDPRVVPPAPAVPLPAAPDREPMWKQRLKNS